ncbi:galactose-3-O-sulfotransferase 2-like [Branchiostoma floridae]|uniref:Galactose-3-O-sulfotransferase 2-like n=1 Tax=Branchiostoma floridae TaxID=7739 RepID=A0A9J7N2Y7_BRAFL|nr:galactose-3-O-sulfotransferase 2-like [Branchiostoma floridae]XP_035688263.1 galactose-3-O-sulfotransferase 2-like [Branchiostoma floridae]XP_035688264.1 galactose-3-O-sulfotransferase 2-like [Branchiostoma floridae]XP_035688265.1 galactose-3-O-sulfotransferase 2-like [Branchiostoma floridae]
MHRKLSVFVTVSLLSLSTIIVFYTGNFGLHTRRFVHDIHLSPHLSFQTTQSDSPASIPSNHSSIQNDQDIRKSSRNLKVNGDEKPTQAPNKTAKCVRQDNFVFAKVHKCGSTTIQSIFFHYGYNHKLIVALPRTNRKAWIGKPHSITEKSYKPTPDGKQWNIFNHHSVYDKEMFLKLMPKDTKFLTILRQPISRLSSAFNYFSLHKYFTNMLNVSVEQRQSPIQIFLSAPWYWEQHFHPVRSAYGSLNDLGCIRNCMAQDLGMEKSQYNKPDAVKRYIEKLGKDFTTVMILEKLEESLVLLKRRMCWSLQDIIFWEKKQFKKRPYVVRAGDLRFRGSALKTDFTDKMLHNYEMYSNIDFQIYDFFYDKLTKDIAEEGQDFLEEVEHFKDILSKVASYCISKRKPKIAWAKASKWNTPFSINEKYCQLLSEERPGWDRILREHYYDNMDKQ